MDVDEITKHLGIGLLGIIVDDDAVLASTNKGQTVVMDPDNQASQATAILRAGYWVKACH